MVRRRRQSTNASSRFMVVAENDMISSPIGECLKWDIAGEGATSISTSENLGAGLTNTFNAMKIITGADTIWANLKKFEYNNGYDYQNNSGYNSPLSNLWFVPSEKELLCILSFMEHTYGAYPSKKASIPSLNMCHTPYWSSTQSTAMSGKYYYAAYTLSPRADPNYISYYSHTINSTDKGDTSCRCRLIRFF